MSRFYLEVLDFKYPKAECLHYAKSITEWKKNVHYAKKGIDTVADAKWFDYYPDQNNESLINQITANINLPLGNGAYKFVRTLAGGNLPYHIDPQRECVLMLPLTDNNSGLEWIGENRQPICSVIYRGPTVINAKILHGVPMNRKDRIFLQVNIPCNWSFLLENYRNIFNVQ